MHVDFAVIVTNILGFLIVLWVLGKFAWGPLLTFLEERRRHIADELTTISRQKAEVDELRQEFAEKLKEIEALKRQRIQEGAAEAQRLADSIKGDARREAQEIRERAQADAQRELDQARAELRNYIVENTIGATEKLIKERLDDGKHRDLIGRSIEEMSRA